MWKVEAIAKRASGPHRAEYALYDENGYHVASTFGPGAKQRATMLAGTPDLWRMVQRFSRGDMRLPHSEYEMELRREARALLVQLGDPR